MKRNVNAERLPPLVFTSSTILLAVQARDWPWLGAVVPGYPDVHPLEEDFWPLFWKLYEQQREPGNPPPLPPF